MEADVIHVRSAHEGRSGLPIRCRAVSRSDPPIGKTWPSQEYEVGREKIREYASAIGATAPIHFEHEDARAAGFDSVVAPPTFAAVYVARPLAGALFDPEVGVFDPAIGLAGYRFVQRGQRWEWGVPVHSGDVITTEASLAGGEERDGAIYRTFASISHNQRGEAVLRGTYEGVVPAPKKDGGTRAAKPAPDAPSSQGTTAGEVASGSGSGLGNASGSRADPDAASGSRACLQDAKAAEWNGTWPPPAGAALPELTFTPDKYVPVRYAGASGDFTPFHLDPDLARAFGLDGVILHGLYTFAQLARGVLAPFGDDPRVLGSLAARFRRPAFPERELTVSGRFQGADSAETDASPGVTFHTVESKTVSGTKTPSSDENVPHGRPVVTERNETTASRAILGCAVSQGGKEVLSDGLAELARPPSAK